MSFIRSRNSVSRWSTISRILAAVGGGYILTALMTVAASLVLTRVGMAAVEAVIAATMMSFAVFAITILAIFRARSAIRAWGWIGGLLMPLIALVLLLLPDRLS